MEINCKAPLLLTEQTPFTLSDEMACSCTVQCHWATRTNNKCKESASVYENGKCQVSTEHDISQPSADRMFVVPAVAQPKSGVGSAEGVHLIVTGVT